LKTFWQSSAIVKPYREWRPNPVAKPYREWQTVAIPLYRVFDKTGAGGQQDKRLERRRLSLHLPHARKGNAERKVTKRNDNRKEEK